LHAQIEKIILIIQNIKTKRVPVGVRFFMLLNFYKILQVYLYFIFSSYTFFIKTQTVALCSMGFVNWLTMFANIDKQFEY
jgi:hypothetical protein